LQTAADPTVLNEKHIVPCLGNNQVKVLQTEMLEGESIV
jgi:hypothetical protein